MNTDTPRTNSAIIASDGQWSYVLADCSRQIERELAEAREQRDRLAEALREMWPFIEEDDLGPMNTPAFGAAIHKYKQALAELAKDIS
jgi:hypothetical protein